jgi:photosystem II stability/assembly factor-like uncharacterized protein
MLASRIVIFLIVGAIGLFACCATTVSAPPSVWWVASIPFRPTYVTYNSDVLWVCGVDEMIAMSDDGGKTWTVKHQKGDGEIL